jgi:hypothetical protein
MPDTQPEIRRPALVLCEGKEDQTVLSGLAKHIGVEDQLQIEETGGKPKLGPALRALETRSGADQMRRLGIVRDVDEHDGETGSRVCQSLSDALSWAQLGGHVRHMETLRGPNVHVTLFIVPGGGNDGMLEDLCLDAWADDPVMACVDEFWRCMQAYRGPEELAPASKIRARAYLSTRKPHDKSIGVAVQKEWLDFSHPAFDELKRFLHLVAGSVD